MSLVDDHEKALAEIAKMSKMAASLSAAMPDVLAGDYPGHAFHGNQYTGGSGPTEGNKASHNAHEASKAADEEEKSDSSTAKSEAAAHREAAKAHKEAQKQQAHEGNAHAAHYHEAMAKYHSSAANGSSAAEKGSSHGSKSKAADAAMDEVCAAFDVEKSAHLADVATAKSEIEKLTANLTAKDAELAKAKDLLKNPACGKIAGLSIEQAATAAAGSANDDAEHKSNFKTRADADKAYRLIMTDAVAAAAFRRDNWAILGLKRPV